MAAAFALPDFDSPLLLENPGWHALKVAPYLLVPAWMAALELGPLLRTRVARRLAWIAAAGCALGITAEAGQVQLEFEAAHALAPCDETILFDLLARSLLAQNRRAEAAARLRRARDLAPENAAVAQLLGQL